MYGLDLYRHSQTGHRLHYPEKTEKVSITDFWLYEEWEGESEREGEESIWTKLENDKYTVHTMDDNINEN